MKAKPYSLGIDTSNYKTSVAIVSEDEIIYDGRILLEVKEGERGLRQQEALFQHINNLPILIKEAFSHIGSENPIESISASNKPRNVEGSYMPCFNGGVNAATIIGTTLGIEPKFFSHQEGHIEAAKWFTPFKDKERFIAFHFSGGTTESLLFHRGEISILGGTKDISFGQVLDRVGVALGMAFPAGEELDSLALSSEKGEYKLPKIKAEGGYINLSGLETHLIRLIEEKGGSNMPKEEVGKLSLDIFQVFSKAIGEIMDASKEKTGIIFRGSFFQRNSEEYD